MAFKASCMHVALADHLGMCCCTVIDYPTMKAAFASGGIALPICEAKNPCTPGPAAMNYVADNT
jgi:hypothetical protein